jgi:hypothetical protein
MSTTTHTDTGQLRLLQTVWEGAVAHTDACLGSMGGFGLTRASTEQLQYARDAEWKAGRLYLAALQHHEPREDTPPTDQGEAWARALDDIGAVLDRYASGPSPRYAYSALLAIKAIVEEVKLS